MLEDETLASGTGTVEKTVTTTADNINLNVKLTTSNGNKSKIYKVKLARISQDNSIEYLKLSGTEIKETDGKYSIVADRADTYSLNIKPTNEYAQIKIDDGDYNTAGEITQNIDMTNTETKDITITVKSQNGSEREYTLSIRKKSNDVSLKALSTTEQSISPIEDENTVLVDRDLASTKVSATVNSEYSKVKIVTEDETADDIEYTETSAEKEITIPSDKEETDVKVYVESENGDTKIYTLKIIKKSNNNNLSEITFNNEKAVLDETDNKYKLNIVDTITSGNIYVKAENEYATIKINNDLTEKQSENTIAVNVNTTDKVQEFPIKITAQDGEAPLAIKTLNTNLDLNIEEFVTVNFDSVAEAVDQLGGIQITVTDEEAKYLNQYIVETSKVTGKKADNIPGAGTYNMNGVQAVSFSRIRYTAGADYKRTERMRTVLEAMLNKLKTKNVAEINSFANVMLPKIYTNIGLGDVLSLVPSLSKFSVESSIGWPYNTKGWTSDRYYGVPITLESNVLQLHKEAFGESDYVVPDSVKTISNSIINKTGYTK